MHLHDFDVGGLTYGDAGLLCAERSGDDAWVYDANEVRLRDFSSKPSTAFVYTYDYGDNWRHTVTLEKLLIVKPAPKAAICIEGARCCPPEDVCVRHARDGHLEWQLRQRAGGYDQQRFVFDEVFHIAEQVAVKRMRHERHCSCYLAPAG